MPAAPPPEDCPLEQEIQQALAQRLGTGEWDERLKRERPLEIRLVYPERQLELGHYEPKTMYWIRANGLMLSLIHI